MISAIRGIWSFCGERKGELLKTLILNFIRSGFGICQLMGIIVLMGALGDASATRSNIIKLVILTAVCVIGSFVTGYFEQVSILKTDFYMVEDKRFSIGSKLKRMPLGFFTGENSERVNSILTSTLSSIELSAAYSIAGILGGFLATLAVIVMLFVYDIRFALVTLAGMVLYFIIINLQMNVSRKNAPAMKEAESRLVASVISFVKGIRVIKSFNIEGGELGVKKDIENASGANERLTNLTMPSQLLGSICLAVFESAIIISDIFLYINNQVNPEKAIVILIMSFFVFASLNQAGISLSMLGLLETSMRTVDSLETEEELSTNEPLKLPISNDVSFENVSFSYGDNEVLKGVTVDFKENTLNAVIGPSGSGKTTLCELIPRFRDVSAGTISIGGADVRNIEGTELMGRISMVFQRVYLFEDTIENNIRFGKPEATRREVIEAAKLARCHDFIEKLPEGYDTIVSEGGGNLSGGEKQRISIARAILKDAPIIILDEATSALDAENEKLILEAIDELTKNKTVIMIAHKMNTIKGADKIIALEDGCIVQQGTHDELIQEEGIYRRFVENRRKAAAWKLEK